jgi:hypothetical protein
MAFLVHQPDNLGWPVIVPSRSLAGDPAECLEPRRSLLVDRWSDNRGRTFMLEEKIRQAIEQELQRQATISSSGLRVVPVDGAKITVSGTIDAEALAMAVALSISGGP